MIARVLPVASLLVAAVAPGAAAHVAGVLASRSPTVSPMPNPVWPLWFAALSFLVTRRAGGLLVLGLIIGAIVGW